MAKLMPLHASDRLALLSEVLALISAASHPGEALEKFVKQLAAWLDCGMAVVQVNGGPDGPVLIWSGQPAEVPHAGLRIAPEDQDIWSSGRFIRTPDLQRHPMFLEDRGLATAGFRSAIRGGLLLNGQGVGRFGLYADSPDHFQLRHVQMMEWLAEPLAGICRQVGLAAQSAGGPQAFPTLEAAVATAESGLGPALRMCRSWAAQAAGASGSVAVLMIGEHPPAVAIDRSGPNVAGVLSGDNPEAWWGWIHALPPGGRYQQVVWQLPVMAGDVPVGAIVLSGMDGGVAPGDWKQHMRPVLAFLAGLACRERSATAAAQAARTEIGALAAGVADDVGNLMTELALQADLLQGSLGGTPDMQPRVDALKRLVKKGTLVGSCLEDIASVRAATGSPEELAAVVERVAVHLRSYRGGRYLVLNPSLGACSRALVPGEPVEQALSHLLLALAQHRNSEARILLRAHAQPAGESGVVLWLAERGGDLLGQESVLTQAFTAARGCLQRIGGDLTRMQLEPGAQALVLQIPIRN